MIKISAFSNLVRSRRSAGALLISPSHVCAVVQHHVVSDASSRILFFSAHLLEQWEVLVPCCKESCQWGISALSHFYQRILDPKFILQGEKSLWINVSVLKSLKGNTHFTWLMACRAIDGSNESVWLALGTLWTRSLMNCSEIYLPIRVPFSKVSCLYQFQPTFILKAQKPARCTQQVA